MLSNKLVLTPVAPGNQRGAIWSDNPLQHAQWTADIDFRVSGPERGGGNLCIWLVKGGSQDVGANSIYTVSRFDGLGLVIDTYGGSGGMIRGFLNDGTVDYIHLHHIDDKAFGHCQYSYRNLGRPSQLKIRQTDRLFKVEIDGKPCFESDKIKIPPSYQFGITAGTPDNPDSIELFKLMVMTDNIHPDHSYTAHQGDHQQQQQQQHDQAQQPIVQDPTQQQQQQQQGQAQEEQVPKPGQPEHVTYGRSGFRRSDYKPEPVKDDPFDSAIPDQSADLFTSSKSQFADLHNRIQSVNHHISTIFRSVAKHAQADEQRHMETSRMIDEVKREFSRLDAVADLQRKVDSLEKEIRGLRTELAGQVRNSEHALKGFMSDHHATLSDNIVKHKAPGHGRLLLIVVGSQMMLVGAYVLYKRRKNASPKKYL